MRKLRRRWWSIRKAKDGFRVRCRASNGRITWASTEGYTKRFRAVRNAIDHGGPVALHRSGLGEEIRNYCV